MATRTICDLCGATADNHHVRREPVTLPNGHQVHLSIVVETKDDNDRFTAIDVCRSCKRTIVHALKG